MSSAYARQTIRFSFIARYGFRRSARPVTVRVATTSPQPPRPRCYCSEADKSVVRPSRLVLATISFAEPAAFVGLHHRHQTPSVGHKFSLAALRDDIVEGVAVVGRPVSHHRDDGATLEVTRLCVREDAPRVVDRHGVERGAGACSFLNNAAARAAFALGYRRIGTYVLKSEGGHSVMVAGWKLLGETPGKSWSSRSRPRLDKHPIDEPRLVFGQVP